MSEEEKGLNDKICNLALTKKLNLLIGSGVSKPAIPIMSEINEGNNDKRNEKLVNIIKDVSKDLLNNEILDANNISTLRNYEYFFEQMIHILNLTNSRQVPKSVNIFSTNYDLFIEKSIDKLSKENRLIFNDGANGYFKRYLDSSNYNRVVSYKGLNDNYINEIPSINLIKPHGSVNWKNDNDNIIVKNEVTSDPVIVMPTGHEGQTTFLNNHFHEMLRIFQLELDKSQSVLFIIGFSFQDKHIAKMVKRALQNPELLVYTFAYCKDDKEIYLKNLGFSSEKFNFKILTPENFNDSILELNDSGEPVFTINSLTKIFLMQYQRN